MFSRFSRLPYGEVQGEVDGVVAYSNGHDSHFSRQQHIEDGIVTGYGWQCVEFSRRWLLKRKGLLLPDVPTAARMFDMPSVFCAERGELVPVVPISNGSTQPPVKDSLLIYPVTRGSPFGHVAVITGVFDDHITIADQNQHFHKWEGNYSATMPLRVEGGRYLIINPHERDIPVGWMTFPTHPNRDTTKPIVFHKRFLRR